METEVEVEVEEEEKERYFPPLCPSLQKFFSSFSSFLPLSSPRAAPSPLASVLRSPPLADMSRASAARSALRALRATASGAGAAAVVPVRRRNEQMEFSSLE